MFGTHHSLKDGDSQKLKSMWDAIHVLEIQDLGKSAHYKLTSTVMLSMVSSLAEGGSVDLSGSMTRQVGIQRVSL